ncbi:MAG TPA: LysR substrate-binding domain-containing protein [Geminicoccaceae bacterium]|nr:LysR substrate-binding domain-containing protein [Geminicoccaceae bacterium]
MSHLTALRALEASVRLGSFRAAGEELGVTAAAVGQQVRKLEETVGRPLLTRRANGFEPTELAKSATRRLASGFESLRDAMDMMLGRSAAFRLAISVAPTIAERWLAPRLAGFLAHHPEIDLRIDSTHQLFYRASGDFDFALRYAPPSPYANSELDLFREWLLPVCVPKLLAEIQPDDRADAFRTVPLLHVDKETSDPEWIDWDEWGRRFGFAIPSQKHRLRFTRATLALRSAYGGHGLHLAQLSITLPDLASGRLAAPFGPARSVRTGYPYRLAAFGKERLTPLHEAFIAWIRSEADGTLDAMQTYLEEE